MSAAAPTPLTPDCATERSARQAAGNLAKMYVTWFRQEFVLLIREPVAVFFSLAFPLVIYVFIGIPYANEELPGGIRFIDAMFPTLIGTVAANLLLMGLPIYLAELRTRAVIRRYRVLPLPGWMFAIACLSSMLVLVLAACAIIVTVVGAQHGLRPEMLSPAFLALCAGLLVWLSALGFLMGTLPVGSRTTQALSAVVFFVMFFGSGAAAPLDGLPEFLQRILDGNPLKQWFDVMVGVYVGSEVTTPQWLSLLIAVPLTIVCTWIGLRFWKRA
ncbi:ABC transporter permease [Microbacterium sp.]|uniref:ABC transporter permease n=1 Tax=Microbacterium sp. TaxID=51671 RepID=UPI003A86D0B1